MNLLIVILQKTIGQKMVVALSGLGLCLFILIHMLGNLFILSGPEAYNTYAHKLHKLPFFLVLELILLSVFVGHILLAVLLKIRNQKARGSIDYKVRPTGDKKTAFLHRWIGFQGGVLFVFLIIHLLSFKFGEYYETTLPEGEKTKDVYRLVLEAFKNPYYILGYSFSLFILSLHLLRGVPASFKSLGLSHPTYISLVEKLTWVFTLIVIFGFLAPIGYIFLFL